jgi:hypothetical protein
MSTDTSISALLSKIADMNAEIQDLKGRVPPKKIIPPEPKPIYSQMRVRYEVRYHTIDHKRMLSADIQQVFSVKEGLAECQRRAKIHSLPIKFVSWMEDHNAKGFIKEDSILLIEILEALSSGGICGGWQTIRDWKSERPMPKGMVAADKPAQL